jgi:beta-glucanase (GH16 family)
VAHQYNEGLFVADIQHMPGNACGIWPAFWSFGNNWPYDGEIDIIEGVNAQKNNLYSLHTGSATCKLVNEGSLQLGKLGPNDCAVRGQPQ